MTATATASKRCRCGEIRMTGLGPCLACEAHDALQAAGGAGASLDLADLERLRLLAGRARGPALLLEAWTWRIVSPAVVTALAGPAWSDAEYPEQSLGRANWLELFAVAGFTVDGQPAGRPAAPVTLWRGAPHARRRRMSWTSDRDVAARYAEGGLRGRQAGGLYQVTAPPGALLCVNNDRGEAEHVLDTRGLLIQSAAAT